VSPKDFPTSPRSSRKDKRVYCDAIPRRQFEAASWGDANRGCERLATQIVDGHAVCNIHADKDKRYGWNR
jgi:hypothetical protein